MWFFSSKENKVDESHIESVSNTDGPHTEPDTNDAFIADDNNSGSQISDEGLSPSKYNSTPDNVAEKNGYRKNGDGTITDTKHNLM